MKRALFGVLIAALSLTATATQAGQWYVRADGSYGWGQKSQIKDEGSCSAPSAVVGCDKVTGDLGDGYGVSIGAGKQFLPWLRGEATVTYRDGYEFKVKDVGLNVDNPDIDAWTGMANVYLDIRGLTKAKMGVFHPYVGAGLGLSYNRFGELRYPDTGAYAPGGERTSFAWSLTAGTGLMVIKDKLMFDIAYRYSDLGKTGGDRGNAFDGIDNYTANETETHIRLHEITAGLRYMF